MGVLMLGMMILVSASQAAPVPVTAIYCDPGFGPELYETNGQALVYIQTATGGYAVTGATCTYCSGGTATGTITEAPASTKEALSGLKYTQAVLNIAVVGAKFDLGFMVMDDSVGIVLGEIGTTAQSAGDPINVYPTLSGVRVGTWMRAVVPADYGSNGKDWDKRFPNTQQYLQGFLTTFRRSDFTNGTGLLSFDGIEISGNSGYDPNIVATFGNALPPSIPAVTNVFPVTSMTFSPGFDQDPEPDGQMLTSITVDGRTFSSITGLTCVAVNGYQFFTQAINESSPGSATNALSDLKFTQMVANPGSVDWELPMAISYRDENIRCFFGEMSVFNDSTADPVTVIPLSNGNPIGNWKLDVNPDDYGPGSERWDISALGDEHAIGRMVSFAMSDFTSDAALPPLTSVDGFRVLCPSVGGGQADPNIFGIYVSPQVIPGTIVIVY